MRYEETRGDWYFERKRYLEDRDYPEQSRINQRRSKGEHFKESRRSYDRTKGETLENDSRGTNRRAFNDDFAREIIYDRRGNNRKPSISSHFERINV